MSIEVLALLLGTGLIGGGMNAIAGGATLFTFPALMAAGLPPVIANATNFLALLPSNAAALPAYREELKEIGRALIPLLIVSGLGSIAGSLLLMVSDPSVFSVLIPFLILIATGLFAFGAALRRALMSIAGGGGLTTQAALFIASMYGGYFGAGLGIILLAIAQILGFSDFHKANAVKNLLATLFSVIAIILFGVGGLIAWPEALTVMVGSTIGGYAGGRLAKHVNQQYLKWGVIGFGLFLSLVYFWRTFAG